MPSMIIGDWCQGLFVWGNLGTSFDSSRMAGKMLMWMSYSLTCLQGSLWLFYVSQSRQISKLGHRSACVWSAAFVKFNWEASWVPRVSLFPNQNQTQKMKQSKRDTLHAQRAADASLYFRHMFGVGVLDVVLLFVYYLFRFNYLFVMMTTTTLMRWSWRWARREIG